MKRNAIEAVMGMVVLVVAGFFLAGALLAGKQSTDTGIQYQARFNAADGLRRGADVRIGGVPVGTVTQIALDPELYQAVVTLTIDEKISIPDDSRLAILNDGILGGQYLDLVRGQINAPAEKLLAPGDMIIQTQDAISLEDLFGRAIFLIAEDAN